MSTPAERLASRYLDAPIPQRSSAERLAARYVQTFEFSSPKLLDRYLTEHPNANPKLHSVKQLKKPSLTQDGDQDVDGLPTKIPTSKGFNADVAGKQLLQKVKDDPSLLKTLEQYVDGANDLSLDHAYKPGEKYKIPAVQRPSNVKTVGDMLAAVQAAGGLAALRGAGKTEPPPLSKHKDRDEETELGDEDLEVEAPKPGKKPPPQVKKPKPTPKDEETAKPGKAKPEGGEPEGETELGDEDLDVVYQSPGTEGEEAPAKPPKGKAKKPPKEKKPKLDALPPKGKKKGKPAPPPEDEPFVEGKDDVVPEAPPPTWKERLKGMSDSAKSFVKTAPKEVKLFLSDDNHRRAALMSAHKAVEAAPAKAIQHLVDTARGELHEFREAGSGVRTILSGGKLSTPQKKAMKTVAFHIGLTVAATALTASGPLAGMAMFGKAMARHVAMKAAGKLFESAHLLQEFGHVSHGVSSILSKLAAKGDGKTEGDHDAETLLVEYVHALIAKELEQLDGDDVQQAVEDAAEEHEELHGAPPARGKGRQKESAMRLALWYNTDLRVDPVL